jgi:EAL domain-containing protein (putative c-di-GMP-specific phosphodiesterase class I)/AmiR/NasT family two-component response regulator
MDRRTLRLEHASEGPSTDDRPRDRPEIQAARIRVLIADDDPAAVSMIARLIGAEGSLDVVATARDAEEAIRLAALHRPDVAILDWRMPAGGGGKAARQIHAAAPEARLVALSSVASKDAILDMLRAGATSYLLKTSRPQELISAIHHTSRGETVLSPEVAAMVVDELLSQLHRHDAELHRHQRNVDRIRRAIDGDGLTMVFQPVYNLREGHMVGVEALARFMLSPRRPPNVWFAEAAAIGLSAELELAAVRLALTQLDRLPSYAYMSVNASPEVAKSQQFSDLLAEFHTERVVLEVTEHAVVEDSEGMNEALEGLRAMGLRLAIDDAGAGFASLSHLLKMAPEFIKLDFVMSRDIHLDPSRATLARGLVSFGHELGATMLAEGMETWDEVRAVRRAGIRFGQGFQLARPGPLPVTAPIIRDLMELV